MTEKKRIAFVMHRFAGGGAEKITITLANELLNRGYFVTFLVKESIGDLTQKVSKNIDIKELGTEKFSFLLNLSKSISDYDYVFSVSLGMSFFSILAKIISRSKVNLFIVIHNTTSSEIIDHKKMKFFFLKHFDYLVSKTIVVSEEARLDYINSVGIKDDKTITIYNPVITADFDSKMHENINLDKYKGFPIIVAAGRLTKQKNYELMLESFKEALNKKEMYLLILGQGELEEKLKICTKDLKIENSVDFLGFTSNPYPYFYHANCFWMTSLWEGLPTAMIEAMACGCVPISTDCKSGPKEILENGKFGMLTSFDKKDICEKLIELINEKKLFNKEDLIKRASDFNLDNSVNQYIYLLEQNNDEN